MVEQVGHLTLDNEVPGSNPTRDGVYLITVQCFIAETLSWSRLPHLDMKHPGA